MKVTKSQLVPGSEFDIFINGVPLGKGILRSRFGKPSKPFQEWDGIKYRETWKVSIADEVLNIIFEYGE